MPFVRGIHRSPVSSPHKSQWRGALVFSLISALTKRLSKQSWGWWFETPSRSIWRHCNVINPRYQWCLAPTVPSRSVSIWFNTSKVQLSLLVRNSVKPGFSRIIGSWLCKWLKDCTKCLSHLELVCIDSKIHPYSSPCPRSGSHEYQC